MRTVFAVALLAGNLALFSVAAQNSAEQSDKDAAAAAKLRAHRQSLFEGGTPPPEPRQAANRERSGNAAEPDSTSASTNDKAPEPPSAPPIPTVQAVPPGPPQKHLTGAEFKSIHIGATAKEVLALLGPPSSRIVIPDDDGHLRESLEYWINGAPMATVRLDNGRVVRIETKPN